MRPRRSLTVQRRNRAVSVALNPQEEQGPFLGLTTSLFLSNAIPSSAQTEGRTPVHQVLVVDDDPDIRSALRLALRKAGYQPLLAESGQEAIDLMKQSDHASAVAAILCDLEMPGMNGAALMTHLHARYPMIPIVVLSGATPTQFLDAVGQPGIGDWIRKPATNDAVIEKVRMAVHLFEIRKSAGHKPHDSSAEVDR